MFLVLFLSFKVAFFEVTIPLSKQVLGSKFNVATIRVRHSTHQLNSNVSLTLVNGRNNYVTKLVSESSIQTSEILPIFSDYTL